MTLTLPPGWRRAGDLSWRASSWGLRRSALGGLLLEDLPADSRPAEGAGVGATFDRGVVHLFDEATGERREWQ